MSNIYDAMRRDLESAMANASRPNADELRRLHAVNAELLEALKAILATQSEFEEWEAQQAARVVVAKAEEVKP